MGTRHTLEVNGSVTQRTIGSMSDDHYLASYHGVTKTTAYTLDQNNPMDLAMSQFPTPKLAML